MCLGVINIFKVHEYRECPTLTRRIIKKIIFLNKDINTSCVKQRVKLLFSDNLNHFNSAQKQCLYFFSCLTRLNDLASCYHC